MVLLIASNSFAQVSVNVNIGTPPPWGPAGYTEVRYYYLPDVEAYYDVQTAMFIYYGGGTWVRRTYLPVRYRSYDLYSGYKVVMTDYHGDAPYVHFRDYKKKYARGYHKEAQKTIGERPSKRNHMQEKNKSVNQSRQREGKNIEHGNKVEQPAKTNRSMHGNEKHQGQNNLKRQEHNDGKLQGGDKSMKSNGGHNNQNGNKK